jgi:predicted ATPase/Tfp pilus assembly protein PilF
MANPDPKRLVELSAALSDGISIDWDAELEHSPGLAAQLGRLRQLEAIGKLHGSLGASELELESLAAPPRGSERFLFRFGPLEVLELVGRGSFGEVYRAIDGRLGREVALKLRRSDVQGEASHRRFLDEARSLARVRHPNVVVVHGADVDGDRMGFWTDFVRGRTLATHLCEQGPLSAEEAVKVGLDLCRALGAVHAAGLVHGDVKAANAMREENGRILLMDFGAVSWLPSKEPAIKELASKTAGVVIGTPITMAPEVLAGEAPAAASDLYSLGVVLHQLMTGRYPYVGSSVKFLREQEKRGERTPLGELRPDLPVALVEVVERALNTDLARRYQSAAEMEAALLAAMGVPAARRHTPPAEPDSLIGREVELAGLTQRFEAGARLVTLLGTAGMGKTRLAVRWGWHGLETWPGGVWFCDLTDAKSLDGIVSVVGGSFDVPLGKGDLVEQLGHAIAARRRCLVILDNFEQVVGLAGATVGRWIEQAPEARFLITSRERLNLRGESVQVVEPLSLESGVALFIERAGRQGSSFKLDGSMAGPMHTVVELLEGIPLAIELAAARTRVMTPAQMLERMRDRFRVLSSVAGSGGRHATLKAAIDGSWELLHSWERAAFAQCSVFQGGFTLEAAEAVLDLSTWPDAPWMVDVVQSLVDKSLLRTWSPGGSLAAGAPVRFGMFASLQEYARSKLEHDGVVHEAEERHGKWYARYGREDAIEALGRHGGAGRQRALELEIENLITASRRALARRDGKTAVFAYRAAWAVLDFRGPFGLGVELGAEILGGPLGDSDRALALTTMGLAESSSGRKEEARVHYETALAMHCEQGDRRGEGAVHSHLGLLSREQGRMEEALAHYGAALAIHREAGNRFLEGFVLDNLGLVHLEQGRMEEARAHFEAALAIRREMGDQRREGIVLGHLGNLHLQQGRMEEARVHYEAALAIHRNVRDRRFEGVVLANLAILCHQQGEVEEARSYYEAALAIQREVGNRRAEGIVLANLGSLHFAQVRLKEARAHCDAALAIHREVGDRRWEALVLGNLGVLHLDQGRMQEAEVALGEGEKLLRALDARMELGKLLCDRAELERRKGDIAAARATLRESENLATLVGAGPDSEFGRKLAKLRQAFASESN